MAFQCVYNVSPVKSSPPGVWHPSMPYCSFTHNLIMLAPIYPHGCYSLAVYSPHDDQPYSG